MKKVEQHLCPVCNEINIEEEFDICSVCGWVSNSVQNDENDFEEGPNKLSLNQYREWFKLKRKLDPNYTWKINSKTDGNPTKADLEKTRKLVEESKK